MRDYLRNRRSHHWFDREDREYLEAMNEMVSMIETGRFMPEQYSQCNDALDELDARYPSARDWRKTTGLEDGTLTFALAGVFYCAAALLWWGTRQSYTVYAIPVTVMDSANLPMNIKSANAA